MICRSLICLLEKQVLYNMWRFIRTKSLAKTIHPIRTIHHVNEIHPVNTINNLNQKNSIKDHVFNLTFWYSIGSFSVLSIGNIYNGIKIAQLERDSCEYVNYVLFSLLKAATYSILPMCFIFPFTSINWRQHYREIYGYKFYINHPMLHLIPDSRSHLKRHMNNVYRCDYYSILFREYGIIVPIQNKKNDVK